MPFSNLLRELLSSSAAPRPADVAPPTERHHLYYQNSVYVHFEKEWKAGNPLFDWYSTRSDRTIARMQRRKQRKYPSFHEYIVIQLDNDEYYRIDRRPDTVAGSMDHASSRAVVVSDTIEQVSSFDDSPSYAEGSDLLLDIKFHVPVQHQVILHILYAVHSHHKARLYTVQYFNCYFLAQVIVYCTTRSVRKKHGKRGKDVDFPFYDAYWKSVLTDPEVADPTKEVFPPINRSGLVPPPRIYKSLSEQTGMPRAKFTQRVGWNEDSDLSSIWDLSEFVPPGPGTSLDVERVNFSTEQAQTLSRGLSRVWTYGGRYKRVKSLLKGIQF